MIKKILLATTLLTSLSYAESDIPKQKGFFVGVDLSALKADITYRQKGMTTKDYTSNETLAVPSLKAGYQYYLTRIYMRVNWKKEYTDKEKDRFSLDNLVLEINTDYLPVICSEDDWKLRGVFGVGLGANRSSLNEYDARLDTNTGDPTTNILDKDTQWNMEYGYQLGIMAEFDFGLSAELGYRMRSGLLSEFSDATSDTKATYEATFKLKSSEIYIGVNYLF